MDGLICEALLLGDVEAAVELCVEDARWADAIILAMTGGSELLAKTQHRYLQVCMNFHYKLNLKLIIIGKSWMSFETRGRRSD